jgi:hypothetical protein
MQAQPIGSKSMLPENKNATQGWHFLLFVKAGWSNQTAKFRSI